MIRRRWRRDNSGGECEKDMDNGTDDGKWTGGEN